MYLWVTWVAMFIFAVSNDVVCDCSFELRSGLQYGPHAAQVESAWLRESLVGARHVSLLPAHLDS